MSKSSPPPGTSDIYPDEVSSWLLLENAARKVFSLYGFGEIRTPIMEFTEIFQRGLGSETEVVKKEMYTFEDRGGRSLTLRPEGTAGVMRSLSGTEAMNGVEQRMFYMGPMFRGEKPSAGRRRQFHQVGVENAGKISPRLDAECIAMLCHYLEEIGITGYTLLLNTRGVAADRKPAEDALREHFRSHISEMCDDCKERLDRNVWRILDCKCPECQPFIESAPDTVSLFSQESRDYFKCVCSMLTQLGISYKIEPRLVRGLDYYIHTVFELTHDAGLGGQNAIAGGGRYELNIPGQNRPIQGVGFAAGMERLLLVREALQCAKPEVKSPDLFLLSLGEKALAYNVGLASKMRHGGISAAMDFDAKSMKSQMRTADRIHAKYVLILGDNELESGTAVLKDMSDGSQKTLRLAEINAEQFVK